MKIRPGERVGAVVLAAAFIAYAVYQFTLWNDPWSSWAHVEAVDTRLFLQQVLNDGWSRRLLDSILNGAGIDTSIRFRPLSHATHLLDAAVGSGLLSVWFTPVLANASSLLYFAICPILAVLLARRMLGTTALATIASLIAFGALLTSTGFISAGIFIFHPAKKLVIVGALLQVLLFVAYVQAPRARLATLIGLCQLLLAWSDESGLLAGLMLSGVAAVFAIAHRRLPDLLRLGSFVTLTGAILVGRVLSGAPAAADPTEKPVDLATALQPLLSLRLFGPFTLPGEHFGGHIEVTWNQSETLFNVVREHLEGAFSMLYGPPSVRWLMLFGMAATAIAAIAIQLPSGMPRSDRVRADARQSGSLFLIAAALLLAGVISSVLLLNFGGRLFMSSYNFYYASYLPVLAFFAILAAFAVSRTAVDAETLALKLLGRAIQAGLGIAVAASIVSNVENVPRLDRLMAIIHFNPYSYGQVNMAAENHRPGSAIRIAQCTQEDIKRRFDRLLAELDVRNPGTRADFLYYPGRPFVDERFLRRYLLLLLRQEPDIEFYPARAGEC